MQKTLNFDGQKTMQKLLKIWGLLIGTVFLLSGCASWETDKGVETIWRQADQQQWEEGSTSEGDVINALGPPSQIIAMDDQTVFTICMKKTRERPTFLYFGIAQRKLLSMIGQSFSSTSRVSY